MTEQELAAIEAHAQAVDSRMSENCLHLIAVLRETQHDFSDCDEARVRVCEFERHFEAERDEAQEAAEEYWEAWQDAAVWWKEKVERLERELGTVEGALTSSVRNHMRSVQDRDRLREALKRYGTHHRECALADSIARLRGVVPCSCGLDDALGRSR